LGSSGTLEPAGLSRADVNTGIVLDEHNNYALSHLQKVYRVFNDELTALTEAELLVTENPNIECYIHNASNKLLYLLDSGGTKKI
jgi:hypothetical protein